MASTLSSRPNHYEKLGLKPTASAAEIVRAFADRIGGFRPLSVGSLAELSTAYETLRNPAKRRAYDASLGLRPEQPAAARPLWPQISGSARFIGTVADAGSAPLIRSAVRRPVSPPAVGASPAEPKPQPAREPRAAPPLPAAREPARPVTLDPLPDRARDPEPQRRAQAGPKPRAQAEPKPHPQPEAKPDLTLQLAQLHAARRSAPASRRDADAWPIQWKRPAIAAGGVVAAALLIGGFAGMSVGTGGPPQAEAAVTTSLPAPKPMLDDGGPLPAAPEIAEAVQAEPVRLESAAAPVKRTPSRQSRMEEIQAQLMQAEPEASDVEAGPAQTIATDEVAAAPAAVVPAAAVLPLPKTVIARTIHRIGYRCGQVASATAMDGEGPAVFKVTCTSGNSYRAAPVGGRYHFRRLGSR